MKREPGVHDPTALKLMLMPVTLRTNSSLQAGERSRGLTVETRPDRAERAALGIIMLSIRLFANVFRLVLYASGPACASTTLLRPPSFLTFRPPCSARLTAPRAWPKRRCHWLAGPCGSRQVCVVLVPRSVCLLYVDSKVCACLYHYHYRQPACVLIATANHQAP